MENFIFLCSASSKSTRCKICSKLTKKQNGEVSNIILVSLLLTLNRFYILVWCFHCLLWTSKWRLRELKLKSESIIYPASAYFTLFSFENFINLSYLKNLKLSTLSSDVLLTPTESSLSYVFLGCFEGFKSNCFVFLGCFEGFKSNCFPQHIQVMTFSAKNTTCLSSVMAVSFRISKNCHIL